MFEKLKKKVSSVVSKVKNAVAVMEVEAAKFMAAPMEYAKELDARLQEFCAATPILCKVPGASHFVEILVAIIIVIALGVTFKTQIANFITSITEQATTKASGLF